MAGLRILGLVILLAACGETCHIVTNRPEVQRGMLAARAVGAGSFRGHIIAGDYETCPARFCYEPASFLNNHQERLWILGGRPADLCTETFLGIVEVKLGGTVRNFFGVILDNRTLALGWCAKWEVK